VKKEVVPPTSRVKNVVQILVLHIVVVLVILRNIYGKENTNYPIMLPLQVHQYSIFSRKRIYLLMILKLLLQKPLGLITLFRKIIAFA
jgi:hypothetical protein